MQRIMGSIGFLRELYAICIEKDLASVDIKQNINNNTSEQTIETLDGLADRGMWE